MAYFENSAQLSTPILSRLLEDTQTTLNQTQNNQSLNSNFYGKGEFQQMQQSEEDTMELSTEILIMLFLLMLSIMGGHFLKKIQHKYLQESGLTTLIGAAAGLILKFMDIEAYMTNLSNHFVRLFMILLLPPIIFESGYNMQKKPFFKNIGSIMMYAFLGTGIAIVASSVMFYVCGEILGLTPSFTVKESFAFGSLISSTDPVAVLAIFKELDADITLYSLIFGESIFNDAIAIVMYRAVSEISPDSQDYTSEIFASLGQFFVVFMGSVLIGTFAALLIAFILKRQSSFQREQIEAEHNGHADLDQRQQHYKKKQNTNTELSMMVLCPWVSYLIAEGLELSGIVAIMVNGIFLAYYATPNISSSSRKVLKTSYETVAHAAETIVFIFLGIGLFAFNHPYEQMGWWMMPLTILNLSIARFLNIAIVSYLVNKSRVHKRITPRFQFVMWIAGLRGAMAYALALKSSFDFEKGPIMLIATLIISFVSILLIGSSMNPILTKMDVQRKHNENNDSNEQYNQTRGCCLRFKKQFKRFEQQYFSPLFIKNLNDANVTNDITTELEDNFDAVMVNTDLISREQKILQNQRSNS